MLYRCVVHSLYSSDLLRIRSTGFTYLFCIQYMVYRFFCNQYMVYRFFCIQYMVYRLFSIQHMLYKCVLYIQYILHSCFTFSVQALHICSAFSTCFTSEHALNIFMHSAGFTTKLSGILWLQYCILQGFNCNLCRLQRNALFPRFQFEYTQADFKKTYCLFVY